MQKTLDEARRLQKATGNVGRAIRRFLVRVTAEMQNLAISIPTDVTSAEVALILALLQQQRDTLECCIYRATAARTEVEGPQGSEVDSFKQLADLGVALYGPFMVTETMVVIQTKFPDVAEMPLKALRIYLEIVADILESFANRTIENLSQHTQTNRWHTKAYPAAHADIHAEALKPPTREYSVLACLTV